jgi:ribosomal protein S2
MGWETREGRAGQYYTRSRWVGGRVIREYLGGGVLGRLAAQQDELERLQREKKAAHWREERESLERSAAFLRELEEVAEIIIRAELLASGCHKRRGEWRRLRESA